MELFKLLGTIAINNSEANKAIDDTTGKGEQAQSKLSASFEKIGGAAVKVGAVVAKGAAVGASAIAALTGMAVKNYADYEQLVGGVETLFGAGGQSLGEYAKSVGKTVDEAVFEYAKLMDAQNTVLANANNAYKTAGMSANEYMETVTSFSASLLQSLGGDTEKAADKADQAIVDMSDNANKMGTAMESIQNAYQGFAKQNYTMLDNLKLGYGGTKEEMQRLLKDAQAISGIEYDISSYADIVDAIHVIQTEMGITGTTAKEASSTISGSISSMKSAWQNLLVGFADGNQDMDALVSNLFESVKNVGANLAPRIQETLQGIWGVAKKYIPKLLAKIPPMLEEMLPKLLETSMEMLGKLGNAISETLPGIVNKIFESLGIEATFEEIWSVCQTVWVNIGQPIWDMIMIAIEKVHEMFSENMPAIKNFFGDAVSGIKDSWNNHLKPALDAIGKFLNDVVKPAFEIVFDNIIRPLVENVFKYIKDLWEGTLKPVFDGICDFLTGVFTLDFQKALDGLKGIFEGWTNYIQTKVELVFGNVKDIITGAINGIKEFLGLAEEAEDTEIHETPSGETLGGGGANRGTASVNAVSASNVAFASAASRNYAMQNSEAIATQGTNDVAAAITSAMSDLALNVTVNVDPDNRGIFKIVQSEADIWKKSTGKGAFA